MKRLLLSMCGILLTSVLTAQTFTFEGLKYRVIDNNSVKVCRQDSSAISGTVNIPSAVTYNNNTYSVTAIGAEAFRSCSFVSVTIPNSVTSVGSHAFINCTMLTSVAIPNSVTSIDKYTFWGCRGLTSVKCLTATPPSLDSSAFIGIDPTCTLTVPCGTIDAYEGSDWNTVFAGRISENTPFELNVSSSDTTLGTVGISSGENCPEKVLTATPASCYHFTAWNDGSTDNPRTIMVTKDTTFTANFERNISRQEIYDTICEGTTYDFHGRDLTQAGIYNDTLQTINGCDSVIILTLSVNPVATTPLSATICSNETYDFHGRDLTQAGIYNDTLQTINGCDSVIILTLSVNPVYHDTINAAICEGGVYTENGFNESEAGTYTQNLQTINGCDSVIILTLAVNPVYHDTINAAICEGGVYTENGFNESEAGTYTQNLQTVNDCDSIVTLNLTVNSALTSIIDAEICEGTTYSENGFEQSEAGTYTQTLQTINGCDSIVTLNLSMKPNSTMTFTATVCEGTVYTENGFNASETGIYTRTMEGANGCDSTITLDLTVNPSYQIGVLAIINRGETYTNFGFNESEAGTYTQHLQTADGCDSTIMLTLVVMMSLDDATVDEDAFIFYPNPVKNFVILEFETLHESERVQIFDLRGRMVKIAEAGAGKKQMQIDISDLSKGTYIIRFGNAAKKLIVG